MRDNLTVLPQAKMPRRIQGAIYEVVPLTLPSVRFDDWLAMRSYVLAILPGFRAMKRHVTCVTRTPSGSTLVDYIR